MPATRCNSQCNSWQSQPSLHFIWKQIESFPIKLHQNCCLQTDVTMWGKLRAQLFSKDQVVKIWRQQSCLNSEELFFLLASARDFASFSTATGTIGILPSDICCRTDWASLKFSDVSWSLDGDWPISLAGASLPIIETSGELPKIGDISSLSEFRISEKATSSPATFEAWCKNWWGRQESRENLFILFKWLHRIACCQPGPWSRDLSEMLLTFEHYKFLHAALCLEHHL